MNKRTIVGVLAVFMLLLIAAQTVTAEPSASLLLKEGDNYFKQSNYGKAAELYEMILDLYPGSKEAYDAEKKLEQPEIRSHKSSMENYLKVTGQFNAQDFETRKINGGKDTEITKYNGKERKITIPEGVTSIGKSAFENSNIEELFIPRSVTTIEAAAFMNCSYSNIDYIVINSSIKFVESGAFSARTKTNKNEIELFLQGIFSSPKTRVAIAIFGNQNITKINIPANWPDDNLGFILDFDENFKIYYISEGKKGGHYFKNGQRWTYEGPAHKPPTNLSGFGSLQKPPTTPVQSGPSVRTLYTTTVTTNADGSTTTTTKKADGSTTTTQTTKQQTVTFPTGFVGTWKRDNFNNTLTFTTNTLKSSSQNYSWNLNVVSGDSYTYYPDNSPSWIQIVTIKLINGNLVISGDSGTGDNNWNGTWKKIN